MENKTHLYKGLDLVKLKDQVKKINSWHNEFDYVDEWEKEFIKNHYFKIKNNSENKYLVTEKQKYYLDKIIYLSEKQHLHINKIFNKINIRNI